MAALGRRSWPVRPRMKVQRMREWRPSLKEFSSWCLPVVVRPVLDNEQIEPADKGSSENGFVFGQQPKIAAPLLIGLFLVIRSYHTLNGIRASAAVRLARRPTMEGTPGESLCALQLAPPDAAILAIRQPQFCSGLLWETGRCSTVSSSR